ncbi:MAG: hypothetical protein HYY23_14855 [Verrucomicrobia bacterium]|nr:hypothetical protein [Verrucomicrobiota bacterium]
MKPQFAWAGALALALTATSSIPTQAGVILISTRNAQDTQFGTEFTTDEKGPGMVTPGDVAMASRLSDYGYSCRLILDKLLGDAASTIGQDKQTFLQPSNKDFAPSLIIMSGSGGSADTPPPPAGVPLMMGEHVCLGNNSGRAGSIFMYNGTASTDPNEASTPPATKYMKVVAPDHPIMAGIPLDAQGRVKIFREPYPEEESHVPTGGKRNFEYRWCTQVKADAAAGTTILGVLDGAEDRVCLAVVDKGGTLANNEKASARLVHMFTNEQGSGGSRRVFMATTEIGQVIFVRAAKWAMGEELPRYKALRIVEAKAAGLQGVKLTWESSAKQNYRIQASTDLNAWNTVVDDVAGADGLLSRTLEVGAVSRTMFLRVAAMP